MLGCGYYLGAKGLVAYAEGFGTDLSEMEAQKAVDSYRSTYPEIPQLWKDLTSMVAEAIKNPGTAITVGPITALVERDMLGVWLPSGRALWYFEPRWEMVQTPWGAVQHGFTYMGMDQYLHGWKRLNSHAGKITENIVQAIARDLLREALIAAEEEGYNPVGHVHDEIICEVPEDQGDKVLSGLISTMSQSPTWAPDMLLSAAGFTAHRYRKD